MTRLTTTPLAVGAETHDALVAARRAKNWIFLLLLLGLLAQITIFLLARFNVGIKDIRTGGDATMVVPTVDVDRTTTTAPTTSASDPVDKDTDVSVDVGRKDVKLAGGVLAWFTNSIVFLSTILAIVMSVVILLIVLIMLVGRLMGVSYTTSSYVWSIILAVLIFPWQLFYGPETARAPGAGAADTAIEYNVDINDYRVPGVLYTYGELVQGVDDFPKDFNKVAILRYARFVGFPIVAMVILFMTQAKSGRGVKYALGEMDAQVDVTINQ